MNISIAEIRDAAFNLRTLYRSLRLAGFTEDQAMVLVGKALTGPTQS